MAVGLWMEEREAAIGLERWQCWRKALEGLAAFAGLESPLEAQQDAASKKHTRLRFRAGGGHSLQPRLSDAWSCRGTPPGCHDGATDFDPVACRHGRDSGGRNACEPNVCVCRTVWCTLRLGARRHEQTRSAAM